MTATFQGDATIATYPLSLEQQSLWFIHQALPESAAYQLGLAVWIRSAVSVPALRRSLQTLVDCNDCLRTDMSVGPAGTPVQTVYRHRELRFEQHDASSFDDIELRQRVTQHYEAPFDLGSAPLMRVHLFSRRDQEHVLLLTCHHIIFDGQSLWLLLRGLKKLYPSQLSGTPLSLRPAPQTYADFVAWQTAMLAGAKGDAHLAFWRRRLEGAPQVLDLPTDRPRPTRPSGTGDVLCICLSDASVSEAISLSKTAKVGLHAIFLSAFQILLHRYSGQNDLLTGFLTAGRPTLRFARVTGLFSKPIILRSTLSPTLVFSDFVAQQHRDLLEALGHQDYPFFKLVEELAVERNAQHTPLIQVAFNFYKMGKSEQFVELFVVGHESARVDLGGLSMQSFGLKQAGGQFELALEIAEGKGKYWAQFKYSPDLYDKSTIERMAAHYERILEGISAAPQSKVSEFSFLTQEERRTLVRVPRGIEHPQGESDCLAQLFGRQAARTPDTTAVVCEGERLTYEGLDRQSTQLAQRLQTAGVGPDVLVGVCLTRSVTMVVALLAVAKAGGAYLPLDPDFPPARLSYILEDAAPPVLVTEASLAIQLPVHNARVVLADSDLNPADKQSASLTQSSHQDLAYAIYTSGSTGKPKGVLVHNGALTNFLLAMRERPGIGRRDVLLAVTTLSFDIAALELFLPLIVGGQVVIASRATTLDARRLATEIEAHNVTVMQATPATWQLLVDSGWRGSPTLRALTGGDSLPRSLADRLLERVQSVWNMYGPTETTIWSLVHKVETGTGPVPIGNPIANTTAVILDHALQPVPIGVTGILYLGGMGVARGYLGRPELTKDAFIPNPFGDSPTARLYRTGDRARYLSTGIVEFLGRLDDQVKIRGFRVELGEVETVLAQHAGVEAAVVTVTQSGAGHRRLVAYLVMDGRIAVPEEKLRAWVQTQLPDYMVPSSFVTLDHFPLTPIGKVDRRTLHTLAGARLESERPREMPATPTESALQEIWHTVLGADHVGTTERFYDTGGDSLSLVDMLTRAEKVFQLELPVGLGLKHQTIRDLAGAIDQLAATPPARVVRPIKPLRRDARSAANTGSGQRKPVLQDLLVQLHDRTMPLFARLEVKGLEHIPTSGPLIVAANHVNWLDFPFFMGALGKMMMPLSPRPAFVVAHRWKILFHLYLSQLGYPVYVRRGEGDTESMRRLLGVLGAGGLVIITPEGTFNRGGLIRARTGVAKLATQAPAPVLPIVMYGQELALRHWTRLRPTPMHIRIAPPIEFPPGDLSQAQLRQHADTVMESMARLLPAPYRGVYDDASRSEG